MKVIGLVANLLCLLLVLASCQVLEIQGEPVSSLPNLMQLKMEPYQDAVDSTASQGFEQSEHVRVDLWLDASQVLGGVNPHSESLYPHMGRRYREGGFHYRYGTDVGWYENVLRNMLDATNGARVRILRAGEERLSEQLLIENGLVTDSDDEEAFTSIRRDLLTYAVNPLPSIFSEMSAEDMTGSFYSLGSPKLNQMARFASDGGTELENPGLVDKMTDALDAQVAGIAMGEEEGRTFVREDTREDSDCMLLYALENLDFSRLSVITFDPAGLRRLSGTDTDGKPVFYLQEKLEERGLFDKGLSVGMYAFQLDYMGQIISVGQADFSEPLIWGKPIYNQQKGEVEYLGVMPRILMTLVIGRGDAVEEYMERLSAKLDTDRSLKGLRGPRKGELTYARNEATITQQPFSFSYYETIISRPSAGYYTHHTSGVTVSVNQNAAVEEQQGLQTVVLLPNAEMEQEDRVVEIRFPLQMAPEDAKLDLSQLSGARVNVLSALLLTETAPNVASNIRTPNKGEQIFALRDTLYVYTRMMQPFQGKEGQSPFRLHSIGVSADGQQLVCALQAKGEALVEGYYRLEVCVDVTGDKVTWLPVEWIDGSQTLNAVITDAEIVEWEAFSKKIAEKERGKSSIHRNFQHAWGPYMQRTYHGLDYPDCPPVEKAIGLTSVAEQIRGAATAEQVALVRFVMDVFVENTAEQDVKKRLE